MAGREGDASELIKLLDPEGAAGGEDDASDGSARRARPAELPALMARAAALAWRAAPRELLLCASLQAIAGVGVALQLLIGRTVIQAVVDSKAGEGLSDLAPNLIGLAIVTSAVVVAAALLAERQLVLAALVERHVQDRILDVVAEVDLASFETAEFHDRLRRATINASERSWQVATAIVSLFSALATFAALAVVIGRIEPILLPGVLLAYVPLHVATTRNGRALYEFQYAMTTPDRERTYLGNVLRGRSEAKEVRLFASSGWVRGRYDRLYDRRIEELRHVIGLRMRRSLIAGGGTIVVTLAGVGLLVHWALDGRLSPASAGVAAVALQQLGTRMRTVGQSAGSLHECSLFLDDVTTFLKHPTEQGELPAGTPAPAAFDRLAVERVSFTYPGTDREVLHDVSLEIGAEEVVALVGANGSGKTTIAKLLCGLYQPTSGRITWDGSDVAAYDVRTVRRRVAAVFQDFVRYELSGQHNVGLGDALRIDDADGVRTAAVASGADDAIARLPNGYQTRLSREYLDGADLSIGEWQRVALARAFFRDAPLLVLDEPTASLDAHAESELFGAIRRLQEGRAVLVISHRFSTVRTADRIYVLDAGRIIEAGTHHELMERGGRYAELFTLQAAAYLDDEPASGSVTP